MDKTERILDLVALLLSAREPVPFAELRALYRAAKLGKPGPWLGKKRPDLGAKVGAALRGRTLPDATREKMRGPRGPQKNPRKKKR